jgi:hypothetical protein
MYWQIAIEGFDNLSGAALGDFIENISGTAGLKFFWLTEFEGGGDVEPMYRFESYTRIEEVLPLVRHLSQIEWGTIVLSKDGLETLEDDDWNAKYARVLAKGITVIRFVDGHLVYIFTGDGALKDYARQHYECELNRLAPENFEWPG